MNQKLKFFKNGGIHPVESKFTEGSPITNANMPKLVRIPMSQHIGAPSKVLVEKGQTVEEGQLIGEANGFVSANIHTSVSGKVISVEKQNTLTSKNVDFITIETGGTIKNWYAKKYPYQNKTASDLIEDVRKAGVVGLGGAAFPTHVKLSPPKDKNINELIINGAECEPYLTIDHRIMLEKTDEIIEGIAILQKILSPKQVFIGIEENKSDAIELFQEKLKDNTTICVIPLKAKYPQGGEKQLIQAITGKEVPSQGLPMDVGVLVENVSTVYAVYEAIVYQKPLIDRGLTYSGDDVKDRGNFKVRIGTTFQQIFEDHGKPDNHGTIISGGPMMGVEINDFNIPVIKSTTGIIVLSKKKDYKVKNHPCIRCSKCLYVCPVLLQPTNLAKLCDNLKINEAVNEFSLLDCIECGSCSYICPSTIPLVGLIRYGKEFWKRQQAKINSN